MMKKEPKASQEKIALGSFLSNCRKNSKKKQVIPRFFEKTYWNFKIYML